MPSKKSGKKKHDTFADVGTPADSLVPSKDRKGGGYYTQFVCDTRPYHPPSEEARATHQRVNNDGRAGGDTLVPFFRRGTDDLDRNVLRLMTPNQVRRTFGEKVYEALNDCTANFVKCNIYPYKSLSKIFRHVLCVHLLQDMPGEDTDAIAEATGKISRDKKFVSKLVLEEHIGDLKLAVHMIDGSRPGCVTIVVIQAMVSHADIWRADNHRSPVQPLVFRSLQRRMRKFRRLAGQQDFHQDRAVETEEDSGADRAFDEEFATMSFEDVLRETEAELAARAAERPRPPPPQRPLKPLPPPTTPMRPKPPMSPEERETRRAEVVANVARARAEQEAAVLEAGRGLSQRELDSPVVRS